MEFEFKEATRQEAKLRMALLGPPGSGKTYSALRVATYLVPDGRVGVIDTEHDSAKKYAPRPGQKADPAGGTFAFRHLSLTSYSPDTYVSAIEFVNKAGVDVLIIDSISHAWSGKDGVLEQVDRASKNQKNKYTAWGDVTPMQNRFIEAMLGCKCHLMVTMRTKVEYVLKPDERGKMVPEKIGMQPVQRDGVEYEFDVALDMTQDNDATVSKTRCSAIAGQFFKKPGADLAAILRGWLDGSADPKFIAAEIRKTTTGQGLLKWTDVLSTFSSSLRTEPTNAFIERWQAVVASAKNLATLDAIIAAIAGMPRPLCSEVLTSCGEVATKRRAELSNGAGATGQN